MTSRRPPPAAITRRAWLAATLAAGGWTPQADGAPAGEPTDPAAPSRPTDPARPAGRADPADAVPPLAPSAHPEAVAPAEAPSAGLAPRPLHFPADHGAHPRARIEWWYVTGWLEAGAVAHGFQVTFFRARTDVPAGHPSAFAAKQLVLAHAAVSDMAARRLRHDQRAARSGFGIAETATGDTRLALRDWRMERAPGAAGGGSRYATRIHSDAGGFALDLQLATTQPVLLQGDHGWSRKGPGPQQASHYYSQPQLAVTGRLVLDDHASTVQGRAWLDHEWSDSVLAPEAEGWDWIGMNLSDGGALTAFRLRRRDGSSVWAGGSHRPPGGTVRDFGPDEVRFTPGRLWRSPASQATYPVEWQLDTPAGRFLVRARLDAQELDSRASTGSIYWEGLSDLLDAEGRPVGLGYLEMTGYSARLQIG